MTAPRLVNPLVWIRFLVLKALGLGDLQPLITGQRQDHEALAGAVQQLARQLNRTTRGANNTHARLSHYERTVPQIQKQAIALEAKIKRAEKKRVAEQALAAAPADIAGEGAESAEEMAVSNGQ